MFLQFPSLGSVLKPLFLGTGNQRIFGVYHPPVRQILHPQSIIICSPFGHEYIRSYYIIRQLADQLAAVGHHVMRFDWYGSGDSCGEPQNGTIDIWVQNINYAIEELLGTSGAEKVSLVGLRMGAGLSLTAAKTFSAVINVVLWDPVINGRDWLIEIKDSHKAFVNRLRSSAQKTSSNDEILGFAFPPQLQLEFERVDFINQPMPTSCNIHLITSNNTPEYERITQSFKSAQKKHTTEIITTQNIWDDHRLFDRIIMSHPGLGPILNYLNERYHD